MLLYNNENITMNQAGISFVGTIVIHVEGLSNPIILSNLNLTLSSLSDNSNATTMAVITYNLAPTGILTIQATQEQADAIVNAIVNTAVASNNSITAEISLTAA